MTQAKSEKGRRDEGEEGGGGGPSRREAKRPRRPAGPVLLTNARLQQQPDHGLPQPASDWQRLLATM
eukprot:CAMPEP_0194767830 /NCGR_PEP_ID=MMETSP0323_2-20130528/37326_1 /TAXON_ID=2866 ORGANISM="Crypthecodinium cohnii, Strain Seligo" /NCGR_SAMPLE_ID=MMETSP0323_2 /ASSEMBLY_ACC=CAM_ASM_000346 /LENGTH=66 /DNA_ID=CAMNT_0039699819 /DNA_START=143 /DNA_END=344 /DNA_ORIENTATION=-